MLGYGHDESAPTPDGVFCGVSWVDITLLVNRLQRIGYLYVTFSQNKRVVFALQKYGFWRAKRGFLACKSMVFVIQKYGFCFCYAIVCITNNKVCVFRFLYLPLQLKRKLQRHNGRTPHCL